MIAKVGHTVAQPLPSERSCCLGQCPQGGAQLSLIHSAARSSPMCSMALSISSVINMDGCVILSLLVG